MRVSGRPCETPCGSGWPVRICAMPPCDPDPECGPCKAPNNGTCTWTDRHYEPAGGGVRCAEMVQTRTCPVPCTSDSECDPCADGNKGSCTWTKRERNAENVCDETPVTETCCKSDPPCEAPCGGTCTWEEKALNPAGICLVVKIHTVVGPVGPDYPGDCPNGLPRTCGTGNECIPPGSSYDQRLCVVDGTWKDCPACESDDPCTPESCAGVNSVTSCSWTERNWRGTQCVATPRTERDVCCASDARCSPACGASCVWTERGLRGGTCVETLRTETGAACPPETGCRVATGGVGFTLQGACVGPIASHHCNGTFHPGRDCSEIEGCRPTPGCCVQPTGGGFAPPPGQGNVLRPPSCNNLPSASLCLTGRFHPETDCAELSACEW